MKPEEKDLLLKDLCARLPYNPVLKCTLKGIKGCTNITCKLDVEHLDELLYDGEFFIDIKPYLRPMSSMTEEEKVEYGDRCYYTLNCIYKNQQYYFNQLFDWLNAHHFDYRGLIEKGIAIKVTEDNNPYKE